MSVIKKLLKARVIIWAATTLVLVPTLIVANYLTTQTYSTLIDRVLGGKKAITKPRDKNDPNYKTKEQAFDAGNAVAQEICEEGMILLKNKDNALPLNNGAKVSIFGKNSVNLVYGGSGSAAPGAKKEGEKDTKYNTRKTIFEAIEDAGMKYNPTLKEFYENNDKSGSGRPGNPPMDNSGVPQLPTGETEISKYTADVTNSYEQYGDAALVVFSRIAGENWDLPRKAQDDPSRHYLELDNNERDLLRHIAASGKFQHIVVLLNGSNYIDVGFLEERTNATDYNDFGKNVDACINIGSPGGSGIMALGRILNGTVNPSGHTVDTVYTKYDQDPTWQNFGGNLEKNGDNYLTEAGKGTSYFLVEYEENIYMGYRYYETRAAVDANGEDWYNSSVVYPFGYGLSYTTFSEEIVNKGALEANALKHNETFEVSVKVKNTGEKAGKQVVQLYVTAPHAANGIEKAHKVLVGFAKTKLLAKNEEDTVTMTVDPYDFACFDSKDKNANGFKGWELEKGDYVFHVATDAHHDIENGTFTKNLAADARFEKDPVTDYKVEPLFDEVTAHMKESLSRDNFAGTFPHLITAEERTASKDLLKQLASYDTTNKEQYDKVPTMNTATGVNFVDLVGANYDDPLWDKFLDQMTFDEMLALFNEGCYSTKDIERLGIPRTISSDGPTGLVCFLNNVTPFGDAEVYNTCYYQSECLLSQTYNIELAEKEGHAIGDEGIVGNERGDGLPYPGWYAPGVNLHRSPFSGRNTEYYSEDPFLTGEFAAQVIKSVQEKGVYANVKHFALNDQETHRSAAGIATWCDEQAMRELYLKAFEKAVKKGESHGLMTSFNRIGTEWAGGSYRLCTTILRNEWGFQGSVICDYHTDAYMDSKQMLYAGGDLNLCSTKDIWLQSSGKYGTDYVTPDNATDVTMLRRSAHNNLYAIVNSCAMGVEIIGYKTATWRVVLAAATWTIAGGLAVWGFFVIFTALRKKEKVAE